MTEKDLLIQVPAALKSFITEDIYIIPESNSPVNFEYTGENNKYLLILVSKPLTTPLNDFLIKILSAVNFESRDIAIVNASAYKGLNFKALKNFFSCTRIMAFGISPAEIGIKQAITSYQPEIIDNVSVIFGEALKDIEADAMRKKQLWTAMKAMF
jgi:hypothetical protein